MKRPGGGQGDSSCDIEFFSVPVYARGRKGVSPLRLSPNSVSTFRRCRQQYKFQYVDKLGDQFFRAKPFFTMGNHVHATLRDLLTRVPRSEEHTSELQSRLH